MDYVHITSKRSLFGWLYPSRFDDSDDSSHWSSIANVDENVTDLQQSTDGDIKTDVYSLWTPKHDENGLDSLDQ